MFTRLRVWSERLCAYDHCRLPLPWFAWQGRADAAARMHQAALTLDFGPAPAGIGSVLAAALLHLIRSTRDITLTWLRMHRSCQKGYGIGPIRQLAHLFISSFRYNHPAKLYYATRLFRLDRSRWSAMFSHGETTLLLAQFEKSNRHTQLWTKKGWATFCSQHGIPSAPVAAVADGTGLHVVNPNLLQPGHDLFVKPDIDYSSRGGVMLEWDRSADGWYAVGAVTAFIHQPELSEFLRRYAGEGIVVVQPRLRNAPDLADLASRALVNVRIITLYAPNQGTQVLMAALRLPPGDQPTSDVLGSTFSVPIDPANGRMGDAECARLHLGSCANHPFNGARVRDRILKQWPEMRNLALRTHDKIPFMPSIGWDLVATTDGVLILEANAVWNAYLSQQWGRAPLGETSWPSHIQTAMEQLAVEPALSSLA